MKSFTNTILKVLLPGAGGGRAGGRLPAGGVGGVRGREHDHHRGHPAGDTLLSLVTRPQY